jgi:excisionase family DNA binding protein
METMLTVRQVCERLQVSDQTVWRWIKSGELPAISLGGKAGYRIDPDDLNRFVEARKGKAAAEAGVNQTRHATFRRRPRPGEGIRPAGGV